MPEPLKNLFNPEMIALMGHHFKRVWARFDAAGFVDQATTGLEALELKQRSDHIGRALAAHLPGSFPDACKILRDSLHPDDDIDLSSVTMDEGGIRGWAIMPMCQYVANHGLHDFDLALQLQKGFTKRFTAELSIRVFILHDPDRALATLRDWAADPNYHVRRLATEGARPHLPWAMRLPALIADPTPQLPILELLKDDGSEYVRRSVANNLNDIAKDHPDTVAGIARTWLAGATKERKKLVRHGNRTLIKQGHKETLSALGYERPGLSPMELEILTPTLRFGEALRFRISLA